MANLTKLKFKENGDFNTFAGNTVVANLYNQSRILEVVDKIQSEYRKLPFIDKFTLTPPESIHMTVIELLCDQNRQPDFWSKYIPIDMPISAINDFFGEKLSDFPLTDEKIKMKVIGMGRQNILLEPADEESRKRLEDIRQYVSFQTAVFFPNHNNYQFHITVGYIREELTAEEQEIFSKHLEKVEKLLLNELQEVTISRIDYTTFESMAQFIPYHI